jgi:antitoxin component of MazEF toxin-antitoxin module
MIVSFDGTMRKIGNSYVVTVPMGIAQMLKKKITYKFEIKEKNEVVENGVID